jgi:hypothetical protein
MVGEILEVDSFNDADPEWLVVLRVNVLRVVHGDLLALGFLICPKS